MRPQNPQGCLLLVLCCGLAYLLWKCFFPSDFFFSAPIFAALCSCFTLMSFICNSRSSVSFASRINVARSHFFVTHLFSPRNALDHVFHDLLSLVSPKSQSAACSLRRAAYATIVSGFPLFVNGSILLKRYAAWYGFFRFLKYFVSFHFNLVYGFNVSPFSAKIWNFCYIWKTEI